MGKRRIHDLSEIKEISKNLQSQESKQFEDRIKHLLRVFGCTKINGGSDFTIGDNQIDACGVCEDKLLIIECTTQWSDLRSKLEKWKGKIPSIKKGLDRTDIYREYNRENSIAFILITKSKKIYDYKLLAQESPIVYLWDSSLLEYYERIAKTVPFRAKYDLLTDLNFRLSNSEIFEIPSFRLKYKHFDVFNFFISPQELIKVSYVARRESIKKDFYQRMIDPNRLTDIKKYLLEEKNFFPTNIVIAFNKGYKFKEISINTLNSFPDWLSFGILQFPQEYDSCWVIDGQHRLFSFEKGMPQKLSVLAFGHASSYEQAGIFVTINETAKPINANLLWDLEGDLRPKSEEGIISRVVKEMNNKFPFENNISIPSINRGKFTMTNLCTSLNKIKISSEEIKTYRKRCASEAGKNEILNELLTMLVHYDERFNEYINVSSIDLEDKIKSLDNDIREFIAKKFIQNNIGLESIKKSDQDIFDKINVRIKNIDIKRFCDELAFGDSRRLIRHYWGVFKNFITLNRNEHHMPSDLRFREEKEFEINFDKLIEFRNTYFHERKEKKQSYTEIEIKNIETFVYRLHGIIDKS